MYYKQTTDKHSPSPIRRYSQFQIPNTYFSALKQPQERQFEATELQHVDESNELQNQQIQIELLRDENLKLRSQLQQIQSLYQNKEIENQQYNSKYLSLQREQQQLRIILNEKNQENTKLLSYIDDLSQQFRQLQQEYQNAFIQLQQNDINRNSINLLQKELKGKQDEIDILKKELKRSSRNDSEITETEENYQIINFLQTVRQQYYDDEKSECVSMQDFNFQ